MIRNKNILAIIMVVLLVTIAIAGISIFNQNTLSQTKNSETQETVVDTTAPMVEFSNRYVFTNDVANLNYDNTFAGVFDASEWSAKLIRFEYTDSLKVMDDNALKSLADTIPVPCDAEELKALGTEKIPTEPGIYRAVLEIADIHGNTILEEVYVIYDTTGARIEDTPDKVVTVSEVDLDKEPTVDKSDYSITDNVDGVIDSENINCELELRDAEKHEWLIHVSYTDRAGNESKAEFLITVEKEDSSTLNGNEDNNTGNEDNENYDPADANQDGGVDSQEAMDNISPSEQALIDVGYGNVALLPTGDYGVLMQSPDHTINGKRGNEILREYLASIGLEGSISGGWMNDQHYNFFAENIHELITPDDEEFWD